MSTRLASEEDFKFFDYLAPYRWPNKSKQEILAYRELVDSGEIQIETLLENALVVASNGSYTRICEDHCDFSDGSDAKKVVSVFRCNNIFKSHWMNSWRITGIKNKRGILRCLCYSRQTDRFHHYAIPYSEYKRISVVEIMLDSTVGYADPLGIPKGKWAKYEVEDFTTLARVTDSNLKKSLMHYKKKFLFS
jgi:hypothetical protein